MQNNHPTAARRAGYVAHGQHQGITTCPYPDRETALAWTQGWLDAHFEGDRRPEGNRAGAGRPMLLAGG